MSGRYECIKAHKARPSFQLELKIETLLNKYECFYIKNCQPEVCNIDVSIANGFVLAPLQQGVPFRASILD